MSNPSFKELSSLKKKDISVHQRATEVSGPSTDFSNFASLENSATSKEIKSNHSSASARRC